MYVYYILYLHSWLEISKCKKDKNCFVSTCEKLIVVNNLMAKFVRFKVVPHVIYERKFSCYIMRTVCRSFKYLLKPLNTDKKVSAITTCSLHSLFFIAFLFYTQSFINIMTYFFVPFYCTNFTLFSYLVVSKNNLYISDKLLYHRRVEQEATPFISKQYVTYPELLLDKANLIDPKVISCIRCMDLNRAHPEDSLCTIIAGGVGYTFVKFQVTSLPHRGYNYDIAVYGH